MTACDEGRGALRVVRTRALLNPRAYSSQMSERIVLGNKRLEDEIPPRLFVIHLHCVGVDNYIRGGFGTLFLLQSQLPGSAHQNNIYFVRWCGAPSSQPPGTNSGGMDGLAAEVAVMAMATHSESEEDMDLENLAGNENGRGATAPASGSSAATKEINRDPPIIDRDNGATAPKVMMLPQTPRPRHSRSPTHFLPSPSVGRP